MSSRPLSIISAGHQGRAHETNHSRSSTPNGQQKLNRNGNNPNRNFNRRGGGNFCPSPSAGKGYNLARDDRKKGQNINHLLNFQAYESNNNNQTTSRKNGKSSAPRAPKGKEDYVQNTAQFVISEDAELELIPFQSDPDIPVPWKFIEAIRIFGQEKTECPICLHIPIAAKVGRCGHAHCNSCILKLISIMEYPECPICQCDLNMADLRSVICDIDERPKINSKIQLIKMKREKNQVAPVPIGPVKTEWLNQFDRVLKMDNNSILENIVVREEIELICQRADCETSEEAFVDQASTALASRRTYLTTKRSRKTSEISPSEIVKKVERSPQIKPEVQNVEMKLAFDPFKSDNPNLEIIETQNPPVSQKTEVTLEIETKKDDNCYYFYQAVDCGNVYLSSLNAKCLITQYGSLKEAPEKIEAKMVELEDFTMDQDVRRRFRYLNHLSLGKGFSLVYVDSDDLGLSSETYEKHKDYIQLKKKKLNKKDRDENQAHLVVEEYYDREIYGKYKAADISLSSLDMFPDFNESVSIEDVLKEASQTTSPTSPATLNLVEDFPTVITTTEISPPRRISVPGASGSWSKSTSNPNSFSSTDGWPTMSPTLVSNSVGSSFWGDMKKSSKMTPFSALTEEVDSEDLELPNFRPEFDLFSGLKNAALVTSEATNGKKPKKGQKKKKGRIIF